MKKNNLSNIELEVLSDAEIEHTNGGGWISKVLRFAGPVGVGVFIIDSVKDAYEGFKEGWNSGPAVNV